jgi:8-oxo-dGTP pyrophosphatase MutT (NUDIX family)
MNNKNKIKNISNPIIGNINKSNIINLSNNFICFNKNDKINNNKNNYKKNISFGIIGFKILNDKLYLLNIIRKNTYAYDDVFLKKLSNNVIPLYSKYLTNTEKQNILTKSFEELYIRDINDKKRKETFLYNKKKLMKNMKKYNSYFIEPERGFPKGLNKFEKKNNITNLETAIREFIEEANIKSNEFNVINIPPFYETYISYTNKVYTNVYYLAEINESYIPNINYSVKENYCEVSKIEFLEVYDLLKKLRVDDINKKKLIIDVDFLIKKMYNLKY